MPRVPKRFLWIGFVVACAVDLFFWGKPIGISFFLWICLSLLGGAVLARSEGTHLPHPSLVLIASIVVLASITLWRIEAFTRFINATLALGLLLMLAATLSTGHWVSYRLISFLIDICKLIGSGLSRPLKVLQQENDASTEIKPEALWRMTWRKVVPILRGLLIALPIVCVLASLLASADLIFANRLDDLLDIFDLDRIPEYIFRLSYIIAFAYIFTGINLVAVIPDREKPRQDPQKQWLKPFLGWTEASIVFLCVNLLFITFVGIQFHYLFGGEANITAAGYTYSEYARRGFGELVIVAVLSLLLYLSLGTITRQEEKLQKLGFSTLSTTLMALVLVILASSLHRLQLYENAYGFTRLRTYSHILIIWLSVILLATTILELIHRRGRFFLALLVASYGFALSLGVINVDGFITRQNIQRAHQGSKLDGYYLARLSVDAVPIMIQEFSNPVLSPQTHETLGVELACREAKIAYQDSKPWQSFHPAKHAAKSLLQQHSEEWKDFLVVKKDGDLMVMVNNTIHWCSSDHFSYD